MILTCPECATRYSAKADAIGPNGRSVRCAKCSATWFVAAEPDVLALSDQQNDVGLTAASVAGASVGFKPEPRPNTSRDMDRAVPAGAASAASIRDNADRSRARRRVLGVSMIWGVTLGVLATFATAAYFLRQPIVERFPSTSTIYKSFGIEVAQNGLAFHAVQSRSAIVEGVPTLIVDGAVQNLTAKRIGAKPVLLSLHNAGGDELTRWIVELPAPSINAKGKQDFVTSYPNPPIDASILRYRFSEDMTVTSVIAPPERLSLATTSNTENDKSED